ncbi:hypothetical protein [Novosphingobium terrae]|uniref:hypothetical protein n=1 Tax=Novosphingobium terrae TaxID=2726189 RepID=UPI001981992F|nr:hypothetical protein [Novosphingobium terrae]
MVTSLSPTPIAVNMVKPSMVLISVCHEVKSSPRKLRPYDLGKAKAATLSPLRLPRPPWLPAAITAYSRREDHQETRDTRYREKPLPHCILLRDPEMQRGAGGKGPFCKGGNGGRWWKASGQKAQQQFRDF